MKSSDEGHESLDESSEEEDEDLLWSDLGAPAVPGVLSTRTPIGGVDGVMGARSPVGVARPLPLADGGAVFAFA